MRKSIFYICCCLAFFSCQPKYDVPKILLLHENWEFKKTNDTIWLPATVPGEVHSDLFRNGVIEDPFIKDNELKIQWISEKDWEYKTAFKVDKQTLKKKHLELNFEGLDTYASVFLNDSLILKSNNAFRQYQVDVKHLLKPDNELRIVFESTSKFEEQEKSKLPYQLPEGNRIFTRKAQFQYGWDWGPKLNTMGIWRTVTLTAWNDFKIQDVHIEQLTINDSAANLIANINVNSKLEEKVYFEIFVNNNSKAIHGVRPNKQNHSLSFFIQNPKKWWPHNLGEPYLYDIKILAKQNDRILDSISKKIGLLTIELINEKDSIGESFYFKVNDVPVYAKGANYIPQNSMQNKVTDSHYEKLLDDVVNANMNMLRVWGGGIYENDVFYDLCDEKGILVWQDFMFACAMYPGDKAFLENVKIEAEQQVKRLRNHASIALWCGNNENSEGWHRWGWQTDRSDGEKEEIWNNYLKVFDSILPKAVMRYTDTDYWETSPKYGRGNPKYKTEGDAHNWWIWHDAYPFEHLEENVPRFMSEFGFQSFPSYEAIRFINQSDSVNIASEGFKTHQKHSRGFQLIDEYMERDFPVPTNDEDYVCMSQLLQAYGVTKGIEAQRRAKPYNMGTLYWQLNDCWPVASWSSIDYFGNWKTLHYKAKRSFENLLISSKVENNILKTYVVNDDLMNHKGQLNLQIMDFSGNKIWSYSKEIEAQPNSSKIMHELNLKAIQFNKRGTVLISTFNNEISYLYFVKPKELQLQQGDIQYEILKTATGFQIELSSKTFQKDVFLFCNDSGHFSDNYFDLIPNQIKIIRFDTKSNKLNGLKIKTFNKMIR